MLAGWLASESSVGVEWTDIAVKTLSSKPFMSEALSLGDFNEGIMRHPISKGEKLELSLSKCHYEIFTIGLGDTILIIVHPLL